MTINKRIKLAAVSAVLVSTMLSTVAAQEDERHIYFTLLPGSYALIGQFPDGGSTYRGTAEIADRDGRLQLTRHIDGKRVVAVGQVERARPGEMDVVRFRWSGYAETCLVSGDLDNYSRLTCYWAIDGTRHRKPGLEAYFPTAVWPE